MYYHDRHGHLTAYGVWPRVQGTVAFQVPLYDSQTVDIAGLALAGDPAAVAQLSARGLDTQTVVNNWRLAHSYPLNTVQMALRHRSRAISTDYLVAQRIKRLATIQSKLCRLERLSLSTMQDIAGCRAILPEVAQVHSLVKRYEDGYSSHELVRSVDYISRPRTSGYRSHHLIYRYSNPKRPEYDSLQIEVQLRSRLQHYWATAVETVDFFLGEGLKANQGSAKWSQFFKLMSTAMALREAEPPVPGTPARHDEVVSELRQLTRELDVLGVLDGLRDTVRISAFARKQGYKWFVMTLSAPGPKGRRSLTLNPYKSADVEKAEARLQEVERDLPRGADAVLVSVSEGAALQRAYPNYFLDTRQFLEVVREEVGPNLAS